MPTCPGFRLSMYCYVTQESQLPFCSTFRVEAKLWRWERACWTKSSQSFLSPKADLAKQVLSVLDLAPMLCSFFSVPAGERSPAWRAWDRVFGLVASYPSLVTKGAMKILCTQRLTVDGLQSRPVAETVLLRAAGVLCQGSLSALSS